MTFLYRATFDLNADGRTLLGVAVPWNKPSRVRDPGSAPYLEEFAPRSADKSIRQRGTFPVFRSHDYSRDPIGVVTFEAAADALMFRAAVSKTRDGDEALELVNDGAMRSVSVGFKALQSKKRAVPEGVVTVRTEVALRELSIAPTGFGQYEDALVLAVRTEQEGTPRLDALRKRKSLLVMP